MFLASEDLGVSWILPYRCTFKETWIGMEISRERGRVFWYPLAGVYCTREAWIKLPNSTGSSLIVSGAAASLTAQFLRSAFRRWPRMILKPIISALPTIPWAIKYPVKYLIPLNLARVDSVSTNGLWPMEFPLGIFKYWKEIKNPWLPFHINLGFSQRKKKKLEQSRIFI